MTVNHRILKITNSDILKFANSRTNQQIPRSLESKHDTRRLTNLNQRIWKNPRILESTTLWRRILKRTSSKSPRDLLRVSRNVIDNANLRSENGDVCRTKEHIGCPSSLKRHRAKHDTARWFTDRRNLPTLVLINDASHVKERPRVKVNARTSLLTEARASLLWTRCLFSHRWQVLHRVAPCSTCCVQQQIRCSSAWRRAAIDELFSHLGAKIARFTCELQLRFLPLFYSQNRALNLNFDLLWLSLE